MGSYDSMKAKLRPLGLYTLSPGSVTDCELKACAEGLDPLFGLLDEFERESFIATAETYGLSEREKFLEKEKPGLPVEKRRALLMGCEKGLDLDGTVTGFARFLADCGLEDAWAEEFPTRQRMTVYINDDLDEGQKSLIGKKIAQAAPVHLNVKIYFFDGTSIDV